MGTHRPPVVMPDMKRRRASTGERIATIMTLARRLPLTRQVLADQLAEPAAPPRVDHRHMGFRRSREPPPQVGFEAAVALDFVGGKDRHTAAGFNLHAG